MQARVYLAGLFPRVGSWITLQTRVYFSLSRPLQLFLGFQLVLQESQVTFSHTCRQRKGPPAPKLVSRVNAQNPVMSPNILFLCLGACRQVLRPPVCTELSRVPDTQYSGVVTMAEGRGGVDRTLESMLSSLNRRRCRRRGVRQSCPRAVRSRTRVGLSGFDSPKKPSDREVCQDPHHKFDSRNRDREHKGRMTAVFV